jgi:hypothetical protein
MKPLQTLDRVMLWVARVFTIALVFMPGSVLITIAISFVLFGIHYPMSGEWLFSIPPSHFKADWLLIMTYGLLWFSCLKMLWSRIARVCLGSTSGFLFLLFTFDEVRDFLTVPSRPFSVFDLVMSLFFLTVQTGLISMLWVAIRPPSQSSSTFVNESGHFGHPA